MNENQYIAYIFTPNGGYVNMRAAPNKDATRIFKLDAGTEVVVMSQSGEWSAVSYNGKNGYIMTEYLIAAQSADEEDLAGDVVLKLDRATASKLLQALQDAI